MVLWCGLNLVTTYVDSGASWEGLWYIPVSVTAWAEPRATQYELQSYLQMVAICAGVGSAQEGPSCKMRPAAISARFGVAEQEV